MGKGSREQSVSSGLLVSQLSKELAWRRKVINSVPLSPDGSQAQQQHQLLLPQTPHLYSLLGDGFGKES
ncbi:unnamed protein product [Prunus armeniaca]|uniref:Uncharacterized protein n=1 Tax=Prunus armeniaca TaxID=36596 RepID=A0A6J5XG71_PRUAR|nr:unnamed protein product [Prunus armeniaca]